MLSGSAIFSAIFSALASREGKKTTLPTLVSMTGYSEQQIRGSIANARKTREMHNRQIEVVQVGRAWRFKADPTVGNYITPEKVAEEVEVGSQHIWKRVLKSLMDNQGKITSKELLAQLASDDEREITPIQASNAMQTILRRPGMGAKIEVLWAGNAWRYVGDADDTPVVESKPKSETKVSAPIRGSVLRYFTQHPGETLFLDDVAAELGFTRKQVQNAMWSLLNENDVTRKDFTVIQPAYAWKYREVKAEMNGHAPAAIERVPAQSYTPEAVATTVTTSPVVSNTPAAAPVAVAVATVTGRLFEEIAQLPNDDVLVKESETGTIYRATPLA